MNENLINGPGGFAARVSPRFMATKLTAGKFEDLVDVYLDRIEGWIVAPARHIMAKPYDVIPALTLALPYFETHASYWQGTGSKSSSLDHFVLGFRQVCVRIERSVDINLKVTTEDILGQLAKRIYEDARCGLFHSSAIRPGVLFGTSASFRVSEGPTADDERIVKFQVHKETGETGNALISVDRLIDSIEGHAAMFGQLLRDQGQVERRRLFLRAWNINNPGLTVAET